MTDDKGHTRSEANIHQSQLGLDYLLVNGWAKMPKGQEEFPALVDSALFLKLPKRKVEVKILLTDTGIFILRRPNEAQTRGMLTFGLLGYFLGRSLDKKRAKERGPGQHMADPEVLALSNLVREEIEYAPLICRYPIDETLQVKRTLFGLQLSAGENTPIAFTGFMDRDTITQFLTIRGVSLPRPGN